MKQLNLLKTFMVVAILGAASALNGQTISYPLAYGPHPIGSPPTPSTSNWYKDYIGVRLEVTSPTSIAGNYTFTAANDGSGGTGMWGGVLTTPLINVPIYMDPTSDSFGGPPEATFNFPTAPDVDSIATSTPHRIFVIWRGPAGPTALDFGCKARQAQSAGASACVIINEYAAQPPIAMGASTICVGVSIPVFMIGNLDGIAISGAYRSGIPVTMTITPWGAGLANDIGIIPSGGAFWHDYAVPYNQISANPAFNQLDGAFIANFGTAAATDIQLTGSLTFNPTTGSPSFVHSDTVRFTAATAGHPIYYHSSVLSDTFPGATYPFPGNGTPGADSIIAMYAASEYSIPTPPSTGRYDLTYYVSSPDVLDGDPADNSLTYSFYATDSLYCKSRYDFVNNKPIVGLSEQVNGGAEFIWGPMYFIGPNGHTAVENIQYSLAQNGTVGTTTFLTDDIGGNVVFIWKWVDGAVGTADSLIEDGELQLVSASLYTFGALSAYDTSDALLEIKRSNEFTAGAGGHIYNFTGDSVGNPVTVYLDANSWYYVGIDVPAASFLGVDDQLNPYPRIYGRAHTSNIIDYNSILEGDSSLSSRANQIDAPAPFFQANNVIKVDSFQLHSLKGVVPSVALVVNRTPDTAHEHIVVGVNNTKKASVELSVYPNPASEYLNVSLNLDQPAKAVTYEIIDGLGRFVSKQTHYNVQSEVYTISTANLKAGNYHIAVIANGQVQVRPFTVIK